LEHVWKHIKKHLKKHKYWLILAIPLVIVLVSAASVEKVRYQCYDGEIVDSLQECKDKEKGLSTTINDMLYMIQKQNYELETKIKDLEELNRSLSKQVSQNTQQLTDLSQLVLGLYQDKTTQELKSMLGDDTDFSGYQASCDTDMDCIEGHECIEGECYQTDGCEYGNPECDPFFEECVDNECQLKEGCDYMNPDCGFYEDCIDNECVSINGTEFFDDDFPDDDFPDDDFQDDTPPDTGNVIFRTNNHGLKDYSASDTWIAVYVDGALEGYGLSSSGSCQYISENNVAGLTPEGYEIIQHDEDNLRILIEDSCPENQYQYRNFNTNNGEDAVLDPDPTEPFTSIGNELLA